MNSNKALIRWLFIIFSVFIIALILWNTYAFFNQLKENERIKMQIWATALYELQEGNIAGSDVSEMVLNVLENNTTTPMIVHSHKEDSYDERNISQDAIDTKAKIEAKIQDFSSEYTPIEIRYNNQLLSTIYYGNSPIINKLKYYPAVLIVIMILLFAAIYFFNKTAKSAEQNKLWAGMAKETAHQIGTPLSSLVGWTEILKSEQVNPDYIKEIEKDIVRLETITERFSKVGSVPKLGKWDIVEETQASFDYLKNRSSKLIKFEIDVPDEPVFVELNKQLYSWTIENLVKNGIDAMKGKGTISVSIITTSKNALVHISDTGKGIPKKNFKRIFTPGFTTKKRGWGLGLSLAKRIIDEYHNGKIRVLKSTPTLGTTIEISLRQYKKL
ncbi:sensor histidine kinase [Cochleicola gelatinilyticus]|uniref:histidine kinase n=1 Tax=Cochleicola gelatinilyticus TaxID=1763537 RepID=A0A167IT64_9FLAO|nr:HAMP domain-containing sensor histidine kinase [Cochleicola gelatinilyticus]OAB79990.1 histidine kinase [Cochleicola gelatinilyticus]